MSRTSTDRLAEIRRVFERRYEQRITAELTAQVVQHHDERPFDIVDDVTNRVLRFLRNDAVVGKHLIFSYGPDGPWAIGRVTLGAPGNFAIEDARYDSVDDAARAVFHARRQDFLERVHAGKTSSSKTENEGR